MACLSPSPSGRRLSELLEEKQEPFFLDLHLLEKGCSSRLLDGYDTALCWPAHATDAAAVLKRLTSSKKNKKHQKNQQPAGLLKLLLSKILTGQKKPAALQFSDSFKIANSAAGEFKEEKETMKECSGADSDSDCSYSDDDEKQLSPVSVLEPHPFDGKLSSSSPVNGKLSSPSKNAAMDVFRELLDAAYSPALLTHLLAKSDDHVNKDITDNEEEDDEYRTPSPKNSRFDDAAYWEAHKAELARVSELVAGEVPNARLGHAEREDVGAGVADAVLEALMRELVVDLRSCC